MGQFFDQKFIGSQAERLNIAQVPALGWSRKWARSRGKEGWRGWRCLRNERGHQGHAGQGEGG